jgi:hypothetical protein
MGALISLAVVFSAIWIGVDASKRDWSGNRFANSTWQWVVGGLFLWILALPAYLVCRNRTPLKAVAAMGAGSGGHLYPPAPAPDGWLPPSGAERGSVPPPAPRRDAD